MAVVHLCGLQSSLDGSSAVKITGAIWMTELYLFHTSKVCDVQFR